jgi:tyrosyl-DNA phosphodiesterase-1
MQKYLHKWKAIEAGREGAMPHIKSYSRMKIMPTNNSESNADIAWLLLTSSNLSKAAWGVLQKKDKQLMIRSYELGILTFPELFQKDEYTSVHLLNSIPRNIKPTLPSYNTINASASKLALSKKRNRSEVERILIIPIRLPYDLPLTPYNFKDGDECWTWNVSRTEKDRLGFTKF